MINFNELNDLVDRVIEVIKERAAAEEFEVTVEPFPHVQDVFPYVTVAAGQYTETEEGPWDMPVDECTVAIRIVAGHLNRATSEAKVAEANRLFMLCAHVIRKQYELTSAKYPEPPIYGRISSGVSGTGAALFRNTGTGEGQVAIELRFTHEIQISIRG